MGAEQADPTKPTQKKRAHLKRKKPPKGGFSVKHFEKCPGVDAAMGNIQPTAKV